MRHWLSRLFGSGEAALSEATAAPSKAMALPSRATSSPPKAIDRSSAGADRGPAAARGTDLSPREVAFLSRLGEPLENASLDALSPDDRTFVAGIQRCLRTRELDLPVLPEMSLRLSKMLRDGVPVSEFVALINTDASLAIEVLKTANSAFYAAGTRLTSLQDAIVRIGLERLQSVLMVAHLRGKVLKAGPFEAEADLLLALTMPIGQLASKVAAGRGATSDVCFMRGALLHVEHLVILASTAAVARDVKRAIVASPDALHYAVARSGRAIREALAAKWNLSELLLGGEGESGVGDDYALIRRVLICQWLRAPLPDEARSINGLTEALADVAPRVPAAEPKEEVEKEKGAA